MLVSFFRKLFYSTHSRRQYPFENKFHPIANMGRENYDLLSQNSVRKNEKDLEHFRFCLICNFFESDGFTVF